MTAVWLVIMQWVASGMGGFVTGRLRTKWAGLQTHEVFFRDTAHGFVMWAVATVVTVAVVALAAGGVAREGVRAASTVASGAAQVHQAGRMQDLKVFGYRWLWDTEVANEFADRPFAGGQVGQDVAAAGFADGVEDV